MRRDGRRRVASAGLSTLWLLLLAAQGLSPADALELDPARDRALALLNADRSEQDLPPLQLDPALNAAAQRHAEDMLQRDYYAHTSPEGEDVQDRFLSAGGSRWRLVAENIARCAECGPALSADIIRQLQRGWMDSPQHRANILRRGIDRFGFGIAAADQPGLYAVQTFAGPGRPRGLSEGEEPKALAPDELADGMLERLNRLRQDGGRDRIQGSPALDALARSLIPDSGSGGLERANDLYARLPDGERGRWRSLGVLKAACGGCGARETEADLRFFHRQWHERAGDERRLLDPGLTHAGFAIEADGSGRKTAILVLGAVR
ncbi:hypothetical protein STAQ_10160 [Allostella sp. ATCC 35155]|nr:hypothetical protein STAQ_10160 [Stella sp. ATCC 35155]